MALMTVGQRCSKEVELGDINTIADTPGICALREAPSLLIGLHSLTAHDKWSHPRFHRMSRATGKDAPAHYSPHRTPSADLAASQPPILPLPFNPLPRQGCDFRDTSDNFTADSSSSSVSYVLEGAATTEKTTERRVQTEVSGGEARAEEPPYRTPAKLDCIQRLVIRPDLANVSHSSPEPRQLCVIRAWSGPLLSFPSDCHPSNPSPPPPSPYSVGILTLCQDDPLYLLSHSNP
ncbi:unnamed protein product [Pleuronectes platessa]|uniref:Uncharacterized protein n=1 Tax=Pleuronectes platessa TaxID=8262 RepID=A0A9N7YMT3_PLEPL|nr:unnamed protein product [Pleuronectes platessa]